MFCDAAAFEGHCLTQSRLNSKGFFIFIYFCTICHTLCVSEAININLHFCVYLSYKLISFFLISNLIFMLTLEIFVKFLYIFIKEKSKIHKWNLNSVMKNVFSVFLFHIFISNVPIFDTILLNLNCINTKAVVYVLPTFLLFYVLLHGRNGVIKNNLITWHHCPLIWA